jgi:hypothetical protein
MKSLTKILALGTLMALNGFVNADSKDAKALADYVKANPTLVYNVTFTGRPAGKEYLKKQGDVEVKVNDYYMTINKVENDKQVIFFDNGKDGIVDTYHHFPGKITDLDESFSQVEAWRKDLDMEISMADMEKLSMQDALKKNKTTEAYLNRVVIKANPLEKSAILYDFKNEEKHECTKDFYNKLQTKYSEVTKQALSLISKK